LAARLAAQQLAVPRQMDALVLESQAGEQALLTQLLEQ